MAEVTEITKQSDDYSKWYLDVVRRAELADYSPVKGCMVIRPYGYAIWELLQREIDDRLKATGHVNAYFPLFLPESLLLKEAEHVEGFAPQVAWITHGGNEKLEERLAVRPTSEVIFGTMYAKWIQSWRDLPVLINQWANVVRWEKVTRPFLRTTEFLWQEGHTAHETEQEALDETLKILALYKDVAESVLGMSVLDGLKSESEKFAGADRTYSIEALMGDGRALQAGTSHLLGQNFAKAFDITFQARDKTLQHVWTTSWGVSTRLIGGLIMTHGDDNGLILPPKVAPYQVVIVPIPKGNWQETVLPKCREIADALRAAGIRVMLDDRDAYTPGWKYAEWELRGVPLRIEVGPRDLEKNQVFSARRDIKAKAALPIDGLPGAVRALLDTIQAALQAKSRTYREEHTTRVDTYDEFKAAMDGRPGFVVVPWTENAALEAQVKAETQATLRNVPFSEGKPEGKRSMLGDQPADVYAYFAKAYQRSDRATPNSQPPTPKALPTANSQNPRPPPSRQGWKLGVGSALGVGRWSLGVPGGRLQAPPFPAPANRPPGAPSNLSGCRKATTWSSPASARAMTTRSGSSSSGTAGLSSASPSASPGAWRMPRMWSRRRSSGPIASSTGSRRAPTCGRGCTALPRTARSTCCGPGRSARWPRSRKRWSAPPSHPATTGHRPSGRCSASRSGSGWPGRWRC